MELDKPDLKLVLKLAFEYRVHHEDKIETDEMQQILQLEKRIKRDIDPDLRIKIGKISAMVQKISVNSPVRFKKEW